MLHPGLSITNVHHLQGGARRANVQCKNHTPGLSAINYIAIINDEACRSVSPCNRCVLAKCELGQDSGDEGIIMRDSIEHCPIGAIIHGGKGDFKLDCLGCSGLSHDDDAIILMLTKASGSMACPASSIKMWVKCPRANPISETMAAETQVDMTTLNAFILGMMGTEKCPSSWVYVYSLTASGTWFKDWEGATSRKGWSRLRPAEGAIVHGGEEDFELNHLVRGGLSHDDDGDRGYIVHVVVLVHKPVIG